MTLSSSCIKRPAAAMVYGLIAVACSAAWSPANALEISKPKALIHGALAMPSSPDELSDGTTLGFGGGIGLGVFIMPAVMVQVGVDYTTFSADESGLRKVYGRPADDSVIGGETSILYAAAAVRLNVLRLPAIRGYVAGGVGFFRLLPDDIQFDTTIVERQAESTAGFHGAIGLDVPIGTLIDIFAEGAYVAGATEGQTTNYFPLRLGLIFELRPDTE